MTIAVNMARRSGYPSDEWPFGGSFCGMKSFASPGTL
jgi:hypothetical protein